jgi:4-hydroxy-tetrahydrodipicolinate synthase
VTTSAAVEREPYMKLAQRTYLCAAVATPLVEDDELHEDGLRAHLQEQIDARVDGILLAGTMGVMQLLTARTYEMLIRRGAEFWSRHGEVLVGVGDLSLARTRARIQLLNDISVDGAVVLTPFFLTYSQNELIEYFETVANESRAPIFLYDLPQRTGNGLAVETVVRLAEHPNIVGIKCSGELSQVRRLIDCLKGSDFRVIVAQATLIDILLRAEVNEHVDGVYSLVPQLVRGIFNAAERGDWPLAAEKTQLLQGFLATLCKYGVFAATTAILNSKKIAGNFAPSPHRQLSAAAREELLAERVVRDALTASA